MGAKLPVSADWELDFGDDNVVPIQRAAGRRAADTQRGIPRVVPSNELEAPVAERPLKRAPPGSVSPTLPIGEVRRLHSTTGSLAASRPGGNPWGTQEWSPSERSDPPAEPKANRRVAEREGTQEWAPPGAGARVAQAPAPQFDPQSETTLEFDSASLAYKAGRPRRPNHADLDLQQARHDDPFHQSALIVLAEQNSERWQPWAAFAVSALGAGALLVWFLV